MLEFCLCINGNLEFELGMIWIGNKKGKIEKKNKRRENSVWARQNLFGPLHIIRAAPLPLFFVRSAQPCCADSWGPGSSASPPCGPNCQIDGSRTVVFLLRLSLCCVGPVGQLPPARPAHSFSPARGPHASSSPLSPVHAAQ
jgi:hypothetical protein